MVPVERGPLLLRPMSAVCERLRTGMRLLVLVVVLLVPGAVATAMYTVVRGSQIGFSAAERDGADAVRPMLLALADTVAGQAPDLAAARRAATDRPGPDLGSFYVMDAQIVQLPKALVAAAQAANPTGGGQRARLAARAVMAGDLASVADNLGGDVDTAVRNTELAGIEARLAPVHGVQDAATA